MKWVCFYLFVLILSAHAQFSVEELLQPCVYTNETGEVFPYRLHAPQFAKPNQRYPLIVFLHGSGECGTNNSSQIKVGLPTLMAKLIKRPEPVMVLASQCQVGNWWVKRLARDEDYAASAEPTPSMEVVLTIVDYLMATRQADPNRIYITGLSLGGFGTWDAIQRAPTLFAAAIPICGGGDIRRVQPIKQLPIWVFHGDADQNVNVGCSQRMVESLKLAGSREVRYTEYAGAAHNVWDRTFANDEVIDWLFSQTREKKSWWRRFWCALKL